MNEHVMKIVRAACQSLTQSTGVSLWHGNIHASISGRNSPYVSHRDVAYSEVEPLRCGGWRLQNDKYDLIMFVDRPEPEYLPPTEPLDVGGAKLRQVWQVVEIPRHWLGDLVEDFGRWCRVHSPEDWRDKAVVRVAVADCVVHSFEWERPLFELAESPVANFTGEPVEVGKLSVYDLGTELETVALWRRQICLPAMIHEYLLSHDEVPAWGNNDIAQPAGWYEGKIFFQFTPDRPWYIHSGQEGKLAEFAAHNCWVVTRERYYD